MIQFCEVMAGRQMMLRRARGYAPLPVPFRPASARCRREERALSGETAAVRIEKEPVVLAVGAHLKNTVALGIGQQAYISQHIGDLESPQAYAAFQKVIADFKAFYQVAPEPSRRISIRITCPASMRHRAVCRSSPCNTTTRMCCPAWLSTGWMIRCSESAGMARERAWTGRFGGEFLSIHREGFERVAHWRTFRLAGGDAAVKEPRRSAAGVLYEMLGAAGLELTDCPSLQSFSRQELNVVATMLQRGVHAPVCSSVGRLFDAVASLVGLRQRSAFEGQAAMDLEFARKAGGRRSYPILLDGAAR